MTRACTGAAMFAAIFLAPAPAAAADPAKGAAVFKRCAACHSVEQGKKPGVGPNLRGVFGRKAGATNYAYSKAMQNSGIVWTEQKLDAFLKRPVAVVPGNKMGSLGVANAKDRADLIAFLQRNK